MTDNLPPRKGVTAFEVGPFEENGDEFFVLTFHHGLGRMTRLDLGDDDVRDLARALTDIVSHRPPEDTMTDEITMTHEVTITLRCRLAGDRPTPDLKLIVDDVAAAAFVQLESFPDDYGMAIDNARVDVDVVKGHP